MNACDRFFHIAEVFNMTTEKWEQFFKEFENMPTAERHEAFYGADEMPYRGYE